MFVEILKIIIGEIFVLLLPGLILSFLIFKRIQILERLVYSVTLSILIVPLTIFIGYKLSFEINRLNILAEVSLLIIFIFVAIFLKTRLTKNLNKNNENINNPFRRRF